MSIPQLVSKKLQLESKWALQALHQGKVTTDMKWIDIEIKGLKKQIIDQGLPEINVSDKVNFVLKDQTDIAS